jgi:peptide/nickel transport system permease protein
VLAALAANPLALAGLILVATLVSTAMFAPVLAPFDPTAQDLTNRLLPPGGAHMFGTDELGRDIASRILFGARITLRIVALVCVIVAPLGLLVGVTAGYFGGWVEQALMRLTDVFLAFPKLILALALVSAIGPSLENAIIAIAATSWPAYARVARAETAAHCHA